MSAKRKEFIVLALGDKDDWGYNEDTLPVLFKLVESSAPDSRLFMYFGVMAYYLRSRRSVTAVRKVISELEVLRDGDARFNSLGIGLAFGEMVADFDWLGRIKPTFQPMGEAANRASKGAKSEMSYREVLEALSGNGLHG
jgi:hypothetical protein